MSSQITFQSPEEAVDASKCQIFEILQYACEQQLDARGTKAQSHCFPIPRIFRICQGRPAVEITKIINVDSVTGAVEIPEVSRQTLPKAKPWRDVRLRVLEDALPNDPATS